MGYHSSKGSGSGLWSFISKLGEKFITSAASSVLGDVFGESKNPAVEPQIYGDKTAAPQKRRRLNLQDDEFNQ